MRTSPERENGVSWLWECTLWLVSGMLDGVVRRADKPQKEKQEALTSTGMLIRGSELDQWRQANEIKEST